MWPSRTQFVEHAERLVADTRGFSRDPNSLATVNARRHAEVELQRRRSASESPKRGSPLAA